MAFYQGTYLPDLAKRHDSAMACSNVTSVECVRASRVHMARDELTEESDSAGQHGVSVTQCPCELLPMAWDAWSIADASRSDIARILKLTCRFC